MKADRPTKRMVLGTFNAQGAVVRRVVPHDIKGRRMNTTGLHDYHRATIKRDAIVYLAGWEGLKNEEEAEMIFNKMQEKGFTAGWGYSCHQHVLSAQYLRTAVG